jgi:hypothetical protein
MENLFNSERPIALRLRRGAQLITVKVRFPKDEEWLARQRNRKVVVKQLGRGMSETTIPGGEDIDAGLLAEIRTDSGEPEVDAYEARALVEQLAVAEVEDVVVAGGVFEVTMRVLGAVTKHLVKMPSAKDVSDYRRGFARVLDLPFGKQQLTLNLGVAGDLYDRLTERREGYADGSVVPVIHKSVVAKAAIDALDTAFQDETGANFE